MNIYLISQDTNNDYDTHDACVVIANNEESARLMNPNDNSKWEDEYSSWCKDPSQVKVELIGQAKQGSEAGFVLKSFNAG